MRNTVNFVDTLNNLILIKKSPIVLGIDPNFDLLPTEMRPMYCEKSEIQNKLWSFVKKTLDTTHDIVCAVKFQSAYFEQFGSVGVTVLARSINYAKLLGLLVIIDVKRGDIDTTNIGYLKAYLGYSVDNQFISSDLESDAITINPFLGLDTLDGYIESANQGKGVFVLVKTSNSGAGFIQDAMVGDKTVSEQIAVYLNEKGQESIGETGYSNIGAVVGATKFKTSKNLRDLMPNQLFLAPGVGKQGAEIESVKNLMDSNGLGVIVPISREITYPKLSNVQDFEIEIRKNCQKYVDIFRSIYQ
jgi:orotidine-5'-phosphate decarboxylase